MNYPHRRRFLVLFSLLSTVLFSCHDKPGSVAVNDHVENPKKMDEHVGTDLKSVLQYAAGNDDRMNDTVRLQYRKLEDSLYEANGYTPMWSDKERWLPLSDSLLAFIRDCKDYGLFPSDYHWGALSFIQRIVEEDTNARKNAAIWTRGDLLLTDAFFTLVKDLRNGRLDFDSVSLRKDSVLTDSLFTQRLAAARGIGAIAPVLDSLEPRHPGYDSLKRYLKGFLATAHFRQNTWLDYPYKDSAFFYTALGHRLQESGYIDSSVTQWDTAMLASAVRRYQTANKLRVTGRANSETVNMMNNTDWEKFKRIAINLDRYKHLPDTLPKTFVWVDLPTYLLQVVDSDTVVFESKVIVGSPKTRTPLLTSEISNFVTYPQWTVPMSIIMKEMLPAIQRNVNYLAKENLMVVDDRDSVRDPTKIN
jgi:murein L,D-transpeptidase YcbB/YkuD